MGVLGSILAFGRALREMKLRAPGMIMQCYAARKGLHVFYPHLAAQTKVSTKIRFILPFFCLAHINLVTYNFYKHYLKLPADTPFISKGEHVISIIFVKFQCTSLKFSFKFHLNILQFKV